MKLYKREEYLRRLRGFYTATDIIKVITGIRRCGKSSLMHMIADELILSGIPSASIYFLNLDKRGFRNIRTAEQLEELIDATCTYSGIKYLFIDEIQNVNDFEPVLEAFRLEDEYSIFITGSNSYLLSGELATKLTGRYISLEMSTLSFQEYEEMKEYYKKPIHPDSLTEIDEYIVNGGFPRTVLLDSDYDKQAYVKTVYDDIFTKDIKKRIKIRNVSVFHTVARYLINNYGSTTSLTNIIAELEKNDIRVARETLERYIKALIDAKIIYECNRFDLKSKKSLKNEKKYYLADSSFYFANNVDARIKYGPALENLVYKYAQAKGYGISVGRIGTLECDFILRNFDNNYAYVQVAMTIMNSLETEDREYRPLEKIKDNYPKYVVTLNDLLQRRSGIKHVNIIPFIKNGSLFV